MSSTTTGSSSTMNHRIVRRNVSSSLENNTSEHNNIAHTKQHHLSRSTVISPPISHPISISLAADDVHNHGKQNTNRKVQHQPQKQHLQQQQQQHGVTAIGRIRHIIILIALIMLLSYFIMTIHFTHSLLMTDTSMMEQQQQYPDELRPTPTKAFDVVLPGFASIYQRALQHTKICTDLQPSRPFDTRSILPFHNDTVASLPAFGIINAIQSYQTNSDMSKTNGRITDRATKLTTATTSRRRMTSTSSSSEQVSVSDAAWPICSMPPTTECEETQLSVIFMAYNPDRLGITLSEIKRMFDPNIFFNLVKEVILVWNGERHIDESEAGRSFLEYVLTHPIRIVYPLQMGFPNDLMNRYHPQIVQPTTKALLYYDDDGPFYSYSAIQGGFELWKRHSQAQIGAMARQIIYSPRQQEYKVSLLGAETTKKTKPADNVFVSHCTNVDDVVDYEFHFFANYDANMVLPSGSLLHSNYLCYLWHPIFDEIRQFVLLHPVHPDDMTVSMIVSQLAGVAPRVYSRRLDRPSKKKGRRRLAEQLHDTENSNIDDEVDHHDIEESSDTGIVPLSEQQRHRSLMFSICWDCGAGMTEMKQYWAELRTEAVNALVRYFGSINSGSIGWCTTESEYYNVNKDGRCWPTMAKQGMLPWMNSDGTPKATCP